MHDLETASSTSPLVSLAVVAVGLSGCASARATSPSTTVPKAPARAAESERPIDVDAVIGSHEAWVALSTHEKQRVATTVAKRLSAVEWLSLFRDDTAPAAHEYAVFVHTTTGLEFVLVPGGAYVVGVAADDELRQEDEFAEHVATVDAFLICRTEVPQDVWTDVMGSNPSELRGARHPVVSIKWKEAREFCDRTNMDLPTEVQWEVAARAAGAQNERFAYGDAVADLGGFENVSDRTFAPHAQDLEIWWHESFCDEIDDGFVTSAPVGSFRPNAIGVFDMLGNVDEWTRDHWRWPPPGHPRRRPTEPQLYERTVRGGAWYSPRSLFRPAARGPCVMTRRVRGLGFRPIVEIPPDAPDATQPNGKFK